MLKRIAIWILVLFWLIEEAVWDAINWCEEQIAFLRIIQIVERWLSARTPWQAAGLMLVPALALFPVKFLGLWLIATGHALSGVGVIVAAKLIGTAIVARLYRLCQTQLLSLTWFAAGHRLVLRISAWARTTEAWKTASRWKAAVRASAKRIMLRLGIKKQKEL